MANDSMKSTGEVYLDTTSAQYALDKLNDKIAQYDKRLKDASKTAAERYAIEEDRAKALERAANIRNQIEKGLGATYNQQLKYVQELRKGIKDVAMGTEEWKRQLERLNQAQGVLDKMDEKMGKVKNTTKSMLSEWKSVAVGVVIGNTVQAMMETVGGYLSGLVSGNAKLSDELADIEKASGLSAKQVAALNTQISKIDTRTKNADLRDIAVGLGQVGEAVTTENIAALDKINVALGDEFGGDSKAITTTLSTLRNNLQDIKSGNYGEDIGNIGNALNVLGAEGLATAPVVVDIANRIAGTASTYKIPSGAILGLAATFQELGINTERGSTAFTGILNKMASKPKEFARVAGMDIKRFTELLNTDMMAAFNAVTVGAGKASGKNSEFAKILKDLDADGAGAGELLSKLSKNQEMLASKVNLATDALTNQNSINDEFAKKNTNLAAELAKLEKAFNSLIQSKTLADFFAAGVRGLNALIQSLKAAPQWFKENQVAIYFIVAGIALLNASYIKLGISLAANRIATLANTAADYASAVAKNVATASTQAYTIVVGVLTGRIPLATAAQHLWNAALALGAGPIGIIIIAIGALIMGMNNLISSTNKLTESQRLMADVQKQIAEDTASTKDTIESMVNVATDYNSTLEQKEAALKKIIALNPDYLQGLTLNNIATAEGRALIDQYIESLDRMAEAESLMTINKESKKEKQRLDLDLENAKKASQQAGWFDRNISVVFGFGKTAEYQNQVDENLKTTERLNASYNKINENVSKLNFNIDVQRLQLSKAQKGTAEYAAAQQKLNDLLREKNVYMGLPINTGIAGAKEKPADSNNTSLLISDSAAKKENDKLNALLKEYKDFQNELEGIGKSKDENEIKRIEKKYDELLDKAAKYAKNYTQLEAARQQLSAEKERAITYLQATELRKRVEANTKAFVEQQNKGYQKSIQQALVQAEELKQIEAEKLAAGTITKREYEQNIRQIERATLAEQLKIATEFSTTSKQAADDTLKFKKQKRKEDTDDAIRNAELQRDIDNRNALAAAKRRVIQTPEGTTARLDAQLALLEVERQQRLQNEQLTQEEILLIEEEYRQKRNETTVSHYIQLAELALNSIRQVLDVWNQFNQAQTAKENAAFDKEKKRNEGRRKDIELLAKQGVISELEKNRRIRQIEIEEDRKKQELEKKQGERARRVAIAQALVNGALAITSTLAATPGMVDILSLGAFRAIQIGLAVATTAAQIKAISAQKFAKGGLFNGPSHSQGGMPILNPKTGEVVAEMEGGEPILSRRTYVNNKPLVDALLYSSMYQGGKRIEPAYFSRTYRPIDFAGITKNINRVRHFETGGIFNNTGTASPSNTTATADPELKAMLQQQLAINQMLLAQLQQPITAYTTLSLKQLEDANDLKNRILIDGIFQ